MEAFIISFIVILAIFVVGGPLGWGIVLTAVLYFVFETVSANIQKTQKKMRQEMDMILSKNNENQKLIEKTLQEEESEEEIEIDEIEIEPQDQPIRRGDTDPIESPEENSKDTPQGQDSDDNSIVDRVDAAAGVLDALEERDRTL